MTKREKSINSPAFANKVVDKVGAGDAMLYDFTWHENKMKSDLALFLGSLAGATAVESIGNSEYLSKKSIIETNTVFN